MRAPLALAAALVASSPAAAQLGPEATRCAPGAGPAFLVRVVGLKDRAGSLRVELYPPTKEDFLADKNALRAAGKFFHRVIVPVPASGPSEICVAVPAAGQYAVTVIHDRDNKRSFNAFVDGVGLPGDPHLGLSRPPVGKALASAGAGVTALTIRLQYVRGFSVGPVRNPVDAADAKGSR